MSAPAVAIPHETGALTESQAIERLLAKEDAGQIAKPRTMEELIDDREPAEDPQDGDVPIDEPQVEGGEFEDVETETTDEDVTPSDPKVKFDDGTEVELSEVKRGYLRQQDYTRKTQEVSEQRKAFEAERAQFLAERKALPDRLTPLIQQVAAVLDNPSLKAELAELRNTDPGAYAVRVMELQQHQARLQQLAFEQRQIRETAEREEAERFQRERKETAERSRAALAETIPAFKKDFNAEYQKLGKYVLEQGIPADAWDNEVNHSVITLAWKAMQYDAATRKTPATNDKLRKAPATLRPGAARPAGHAQIREVREATERAHKSGSVQDAYAAQLAKLNARR